ncbi:hypothetical protein BJF83_10470 [Nocardiopsis sp. CNR-923]|uniref:hypothetical protein n=1 Tax=Nocardiopsis sp. CNR-923 TaxID=1904965 RepID=UPI00095FACE4|nr:hypothetical protein [Nocardiopsis sp. CNR-923]OLT29774.1 hypothetical protein BJF83_10470 [Nocardiopsis sp. CNR-923]
MTEHRTASHRSTSPHERSGGFPALLRAPGRVLFTLALAAGAIAGTAAGAAAEIGYEHRSVQLNRFEARLTVVRTTVTEEGSVVHTESEYFAGPEGGGVDNVRTWVD